MIVTLAGHVDHGKTTLVRLLTGTDTDRLQEEKRRGLTIDLGFAYLRDADTTLGFVDVPGHHRFIHNMVAGVAAMQHALLVIAADDGPMPQSREHLQILQLLGVAAGVVALSKCDSVPPERIAEARAEIARLVAGTFLESAAVIETSASSGHGVDALRGHLLAAAAADTGLADRPFRMPVDRAFTLKGAGLVVTGTVHAGRVAVDDELHLFPLGLAGRVRDLRVQDGPAASASVGDRAALNLVGPDRADVTRGHWLCEHPQRGHRSLVVDFQTLSDYPRELRHWAPVHVYHATSHTTARLALLQGPRLLPGERTWVELVLDEPLLGKRGDRLIVRDQALERTLGGGTIIDNRPSEGRRRSPARLQTIEACSAATAEAALGALLAQGPVDPAAFQGLWDLSAPALQATLASHAAADRNGWLVSDELWGRWVAELEAECRTRHEADPTLQGLRENDFATPVPARFRGAALAELAASGALEQRAGRFRPRAHQAALSKAEQDLLQRLRPLLEQRQPPSLGDLGKTLRIPLARLEAGVKGLAHKGTVVLVNAKRVYLPARLAELADIAEQLSARGPFSVRDYRDAAAIGRNVAIDVLEYFDGRGFTRRSGETRSVVGKRSLLGSALG